LKERCLRSASELVFLAEEISKKQVSGEVPKAGALCCVRTVSKPYLFWLLGLAFERKADAPSYCKQKRKEPIEGLELSRELAKQMLSQLSYTPILVIILF
jgi:hypothetical protein